MAQATFKGREASAGTGVPVDLTATQARTILNINGTLDVDKPVSTAQAAADQAIQDDVDALAAATTSALSGKQATSEKGAANGYAGLDSGALVANSILQTSVQINFAPVTTIAGLPASNSNTRGVVKHSYLPYYGLYKDASNGWTPLAAPLISPGLDSSSRPIFGFPFALFGCEIQYYSTKRVRVVSGAWNASSPDRMFGFDTYFDFDVDVVQLNGYDGGVGASMTAGWHYAYLLGKSTAAWNDTKCVFSKEISVSGCRANLNANVAGSSAYDYMRKLPFAAYYDGTDFRLWNMSGGYPMPSYEFIGADCSSTWRM